MIDSKLTTFLFTDIEGSTQLWEREPERMQRALLHHDACARTAVEAHHGVLVKSTGDGIFAVFDDPLDGINAVLQLQQSLERRDTPGELTLRVRCGLHLGVNEQRSDDYFGTAVNRAARIMAVAHGGQVLLSMAVAAVVQERLSPDISLRDLGWVRLRDLSHPEHIHQLVHASLQQDFPPLHSLETQPNNLPQQMTSFIGRERELAEASALLTKVRLLTLLGVGGLGKTRLSLQLAVHALDAFADGVWFVEFAPLTDPRLVGQAVASVLGVKEEAGRPVMEALVKFVKDRSLLLILDNCEHMIESCAALGKVLLQASHHLKIVATSREPLHIAGEAMYQVPPLSFPSPNAAPSAANVMQCEALRLFVERAVAAQPMFRVTDNNAAAIARICRRLDGIPLAIELAAARVRAFSIETIVERLNRRFGLLTGGDRTALPRQQTLRALIDWSYDLLTPSEQKVLQRLSVFAGGWKLEAAEAIVADDGIDQSEVLDLLCQLVDKSLVMAEPEGSRFRLLETIRQYAQDRMKESGNATHAREQHFSYYLAFAERARPELVGPDQGAWLARLDDERENLLAAHAWCDRAADGGEAGLQLAFSAKNYWINRGLLGLGLQMTVEALRRPGAQQRGLPRCRALFIAGQIGCFMDRYAEAQGYLEESLAIAREIPDRARIATTLQPLGWASIGQGDLATARAYLDEALHLARELGNKREMSAALNLRALLHRVEREPELAAPLYDEALAIARELGDRETIAIGLLNLAILAIGRESGESARGMLLQVARIVDEIGSKRMGKCMLEECAGLAAFQQQWAQVGEFYGAAEAQTSQTGIKRDPADEAFLAARVTTARAALGPAAFDNSVASGRLWTYEQAINTAREWLQLPVTQSVEQRIAP